MKILLIGGSSDLGRALVDELPNTINFDIQDQNPKASQFILGNLTNPLDLKNLPAFDAIVHISGIHPLISNNQNLSLMRKVNVEGVENVLQTLKPQKFIYISSSSASKPTDYGLSKLAGEQLVEAYSKNNPNTQNYILRTKGFTPFTSPSYKNFLDYANWNLSGAVHIQDVVQAVKCCLTDNNPGTPRMLITGRDEFTDLEKQNWGLDILLQKYPQAQDLIHQLTIPATAPVYGDFSNPVGYSPKYGFSQVVQEWVDLQK